MHDSTCSYWFHLNEYNQGLSYYPFAVNLNRCVESFNNLNDKSNRVCVPNKTVVFNVITWISESKNLIKHIFFKCEYNFYGKNCDPNIWKKV